MRELFYQIKLALHFFTFFVHFKSNFYLIISTTGRIVVSLFYPTSFIDSDQLQEGLLKTFCFTYKVTHSVRNFRTSFIHPTISSQELIYNVHIFTRVRSDSDSACIRVLLILFQLILSSNNFWKLCM